MGANQKLTGHAEHLIFRQKAINSELKAALGSIQRLLSSLMLESRFRLAVHGGSRLLMALEVLLRSSREVALSNSGLRTGNLGGRGSATEHLLSLGGVVTHELLGGLGSVGGVGGGGLAKLLGLGTNELLGILKVVVDKLLVANVDQGYGEEKSGGKEGESPVGNNLDEPVGEESAQADSHGCPDVLSEDDALGLNDEEVDQLVDIANNGIESLTGNSVVAAGTELASKTSVHDGLAGNLSGNSDAKDHPGKLEAPSQQIQVSNRKDEGDGGGVGNSRGTRVVPRQELGEEGVVVGQRLAGGSWVVRNLARSGEVGELVRGFLVLLLDLVGDGAVGDRIEGVGHGECVGVSKILRMARMEHVLYLDVL